MNRPVRHEPLAREESSARTGARLRRVTSVLCVAGAVVLADQATKAVVRGALNDGRVVDLFGGLIRLDYTRNTGAAFGLYQSGGVIFAVAAVLASAGIVGYAWRASTVPLAVSAGLGLILGGALGNLIDRVHLGYVVDFIDLRWWPVFNLADSCIVIGVSLLVLRALLAGDGRAAP